MNFLLLFLVYLLYAIGFVLLLFGLLTADLKFYVTSIVLFMVAIIIDNYNNLDNSNYY